MEESTSNSAQKNRLRLNKDTRGEELLIESDSNTSEANPETVLATDSEGNSLTLLEELSLREGKSHPLEFVVAFLCAAASIAFASLIYLNITIHG